VDGVGHVVSFALFDFQRHGDGRYGAPASGTADQQSRDGKMEKAYLSFRVHHPSWNDERGAGGSELLGKV
jgi:autophagy-related protein 9